MLLVLNVAGENENVLRGSKQCKLYGVYMSCIVFSHKMNTVNNDHHDYIIFAGERTDLMGRGLSRRESCSDSLNKAHTPATSTASMSGIPSNRIFASLRPCPGLFTSMRCTRLSMAQSTGANKSHRLLVSDGQSMAARPAPLLQALHKQL